MTYFLKSGNTFSLTAEDNVDIRKSLPVATYMVRFSMDRGYFLEIVDNLTIKGKVYGNLDARADRIVSTYKARPRNTGVLLNGAKGSGKTLLTKRVSEKMLALGVVTLIVNQPYSGDAFNVFLQAIDQDTVVIFDEFEKVYPSEKQEQILTLLDGVFPSKKLFMLTVNDMKRVDQHMLNRPGRLFYSVKYAGLDRDFILEYCNDVLKDKSQGVSVANLASLFKHFNFDMLQSLVEEMNRYDESAKDALAMLNVRPDTFQYADHYNVTVMIPGWEGPAYVQNAEKGAVKLYSPLAKDVELIVYRSEDDFKEYQGFGRRKARAVGDELDSQPYIQLKLENHQITSMDGNGGFFYRLEDGTEVTLVKRETYTYDYRAAL